MVVSAAHQHGSSRRAGSSRVKVRKPSATPTQCIKIWRPNLGPKAADVREAKSSATMTRKLGAMARIERSESETAMILPTRPSTIRVLAPSH